MPFLQPGTYPLKCRECGIDFIAAIEQDDVDDGCEPSRQRCYRCWENDPRIATLTHEGVVEAITLALAAGRLNPL